MSNMQFISDIAKLNELKYKKRPIIAEFFTEYFWNNPGGVHPVSPAVKCSKRISKKAKPTTR